MLEGAGIEHVVQGALSFAQRGPDLHQFAVPGFQHLIVLFDRSFQTLNIRFQLAPCVSVLCIDPLLFSPQLVEQCHFPCIENGRCRCDAVAKRKGYPRLSHAITIISLPIGLGHDEIVRVSRLYKLLVLLNKFDDRDGVVETLNVSEGFSH